MCCLRNLGFNQKMINASCSSCPISRFPLMLVSLLCVYQVLDRGAAFVDRAQEGVGLPWRGSRPLWALAPVLLPPATPSSLLAPASTATAREWRMSAPVSVPVSVPAADSRLCHRYQCMEESLTDRRYR